MNDIERRERRELHLELLNEVSRTVPVPWLWPARMRELRDGLLGADWLVGVHAGEDSGGNLFLSMEALHRASERKARATWHTRATNGKSLRLFSCMLFAPYVGWYHLTVKALLVKAGEVDSDG